MSQDVAPVVEPVVAPAEKAPKARKRTLPESPVAPPVVTAPAPVFHEVILPKLQAAIADIAKEHPEVRTIIGLIDWTGELNNANLPFIAFGRKDGQLNIADLLGQHNQVHAFYLQLTAALRQQLNNMAEKVVIGLNETQQKDQRIQQLEAELASAKGETPVEQEPAPKNRSRAKGDK